MKRRDFTTYMLATGALSSFSSVFARSASQDMQTWELASSHNSRIRLHADIEPLVRLLEDTPREGVVEAFAPYIREGIGTAPLWTATLLAGARGLKPHPVGFKFHAVLMINPAEQMSREVSPSDFWLPLFWNMDNFKQAQVQNAKEGGWFMQRLSSQQIASPSRAKALFQEGMDYWDEAKADAGIAGLYRSASASEIYELFWRYGARDFRDIGHKAIYVAHSWRLLTHLGWRHAEPVLRSLALALLEHEGTNPAHRDGEADRPWRHNQELHRQARANWRTTGQLSASGMLDLWTTLRSASWAEACNQIVTLLNRKISPLSLWEALFLRSGELLMQQPGIIAVHCVTSINALHYAYETTTHEDTKLLLLLQAAAFLVMFRDLLKSRGDVREDLKLNLIEPLAPLDYSDDGIFDIFANLKEDRLIAAQKTLGWLQNSEARVSRWMRVARHLICNKAQNSHDYKFCEASFEDYSQVSTGWQARYLISSLFNLMPSSEPDNDVTLRVRASFA